MDFNEVLKAAGAAAGSIALLWRVWDEFGAHLRISLQVEAPSGSWATALTTVDNKGNRPKDIAYALLLVGPEEESPLETAKVLAQSEGYKGDMNTTNDLGYFRVETIVSQGDRMIIPMPFYYRENVNIADETLTYRAPIPVASLRSGVAYSVRFFLFPPLGSLLGHLHRSTHDCFIVPSITDID